MLVQRLRYPTQFLLFYDRVCNFSLDRSENVSYILTLVKKSNILWQLKAYAEILFFLYGVRVHLPWYIGLNLWLIRWLAPDNFQNCQVSYLTKFRTYSRRFLYCLYVVGQTVERQGHWQWDVEITLNNKILILEWTFHFEKKLQYVVLVSVDWVALA